MLQVLNSNRIRDKVIERFNLMDHYGISLNSKYPYTKLNKLYDSRIRFRRTEYNAVRITVMDADPAIAAKIANDIAELYDTTMNAMQKEVAVKAFQLVDTEYKNLCAEMAVLEDSLNTLRSLGVFDYEAQVEMLSQQLAVELGKGNNQGVKNIQDHLDILAKYEAKATFFWVGSEIMTDDDKALVQRAFDEGHQLCTHTYTFSQSVSSFDFSSLETQDQIDEINLGYQAISNVTGVEPSHCVRLPGGTMADDAVLNLSPYIDAEIAWTLDTGDWLMPGSDAIYEQLVQAKPGDIILCHDSADSHQTVDALRRALPVLKGMGFKFVTVDDMLTYPELEAEEE